MQFHNLISLVYRYHKRLRHPLFYGIPLLLASALVLFSSTDSGRVKEFDTDGDRMTDAYETFFGLDTTNSADASLDYDADHLSNLREFAQLTDPFALDTDRDGFSDDMDENPISRAYIAWGDPQFTSDDNYDYAHPDWFLAAYKNGGEWMAARCGGVTNMPLVSAWHVSANESNDIGSLSVDLDRAVLTNNLVYAVHYLDSSNSSLYVDLLDADGEVVVEDLYGNLMTGDDQDAMIWLAVPLVEFTNAAVIHLRRGTGDVVVYEGQLYIDEDGDGLDADQERQLGFSDYRVDTDGDGVSDYEAYFHKKNDNQPEPPDPGKEKDKGRKGIVYVDQAVGNDTYTGRAASVSRKKGPKKTVHGGLSVAETNDTIIIRSGNYNEDLNIQGKDVHVFIEGNVRL